MDDDDRRITLLILVGMALGTSVAFVLLLLVMLN